MGRRTRLPLGELGDTRHLLGFRGKFSESAPAPVRARSFRGPAGRAEYFSLWEKSGARGAYMVFAENLRKSRPRACVRAAFGPPRATPNTFTFGRIGRHAAPTWFSREVFGKRARARACAQLSGPRGPRRILFPLGKVGGARRLHGLRGKSSEIAPARVRARGFRVPAGHAEHSYLWENWESRGTYLVFAGSLRKARPRPCVRAAFGAPRAAPNTFPFGKSWGRAAPTWSSRKIFGNRARARARARLSGPRGPRRTLLPLGELGDTRHLLGFRGKSSESAPAPVRARSFRGPAGRAEYFSLWEKLGARGAYMVFAENLRKSRPRACVRAAFGPPRATPNTFTFGRIGRHAAPTWFSRE